ncbi:MAG: efflux RND transporter periplasmic adaptor subunit [Gammaproteobacteria bacterium]|nr:efflux RND transporter periplasmic adaptor subunit [Gammaproteobacteria bacterium]NND39129.1 efflux RND transporter periplasmic adaptor subunit [Pseudomonadales bacterium]MBT8150790.1 efflux RND transporter periplasmic adaptor subunit [Gammaproteobacteria bacterium]NNL10724.1 efflux RND transporter periplasmic adaptor subunit [Pseudomonadales bacterium]NNM10552.1 efflux RND transporter periplasmic adaptor subunit [Pseudomonadales bacterium]
MKKNRIIPIGIALGLAAALYWSLKPAPVLVESAVAKRAQMRVTIDEEGVTRVKHRYIVSAPVAGYLHRIDHDVGKIVASGEVLATLEPLPSDVLDPRRRAEAQARVSAARASLRSAEQQVAAAKADADFARSEYDRKKPLADKGAISAEAMSETESIKRRALAVLQSARFTVDVARYEVDAAKTMLQYSGQKANNNHRVPLAAPISGAILKIFKESEGVVAAGSMLLELGEPRALEVAIDALSADAVRINPGTDVLLKRWGGDTLEARVRTIEPVGFTKVSALGVEEQRVWIIVDILSPPEQWQALGDGYRVEAQFLLWQQDDVLTIPEAAVFKVGQQWSAFVIEGGRVSMRELEPGQRNGLEVQVIDGLSEGEQVVVYPDERLEDGSSVRAR